MNNNCPCRGCTVETGRSETCHSTCQKYQDWLETNRKVKAEIKSKKDKEAMVRLDNIYRVRKMRGLSTKGYV